MVYLTCQVDHSALADNSPALQSQKAVAAYLKSKQLPSFGFSRHG